MYETRLDANLAFFDGLDGQTAWPLEPDGRHPLRDLLVGDFLIIDVAHGFAGGDFLEIEQAILGDRPHRSAGGRWLDDDILDELLTLMVNGGQGERFGDGVVGPTKPASVSFPYVRKPNNRTEPSPTRFPRRLTMESMAGKGAVVTGAASGIGNAIATAFIDAGAGVVLCDRNVEAVEAAARELGDRAIGHPSDVSDERQVEGAMRAARAAFGSLDVVVNCAGFGAIVPLTELTAEKWNAVHAVTLGGVFYGVKQGARQMLEQGHAGVIINISSVNGQQPGEGQVAYCSAKAGVDMITRCGALELGGRGIRVVGIAPGLVETPLTKKELDDPATRELFMSVIPMKRAVQAQEIAAAAVYLASDNAASINGHTMVIDGGSLTRGYPALLTDVPKAE